MKNEKRCSKVIVTKVAVVCKREVYNAALEGVEWIITIFSSKNLSLLLFQAGLSMKDNIEESQY